MRLSIMPLDVVLSERSLPVIMQFARRTMPCGTVGPLESPACTPVPFREIVTRSRFTLLNELVDAGVSLHSHPIAGDYTVRYRKTRIVLSQQTAEVIADEVRT